MAIEYIGTDYGGWLLDLDLVPDGSTIISAGVGEDISFDLGLIERRACRIIGIDPTVKSHNYIESMSLPSDFILIKKALGIVNGDIIKFFKNKNPHHVSESVLSTHSSVNNFDYYLAETVSMQSLFDTYRNISVIKLDIEGSEYEVLKSIDNIPDSVCQICVEFHHFCTDKTIEETREIIDILGNHGFVNYAEKPSSKSLTELTFWKAHA